MISTRIRTLLEPPNSDISVERAVSLLNGTLTSLDSPESDDVLDKLLESARRDSEQLDSQFAQSQSDIDALLAQIRSDAQEHLTAAQELALMRHSLADELASLSEVLVSTANAGVDGDMGPTLLEEIETLHRNLKELQCVKSYVEVIHKALALSEQAVNQFKQSISSSDVKQSSLKEYIVLQQLVSSVRTACSNIEGGDNSGLRLVSFLEGILRKTWASMKDLLGTSLLVAADKLRWPMPVDYFAAEAKDKMAFESVFRNMLILQSLGETVNVSDGPSKSQGHPEGLYPLQVLIKPVALRFKYHFDGTRQTNRIDKPEWYFAHILNVAHEQRNLMEGVIQRLIRGSPYKHINAWREFTALLLPIISRKIRKSIPGLLPHPPLLAHTIYQALTFDSALRDAGFGLNGTTQQLTDETSKDWEGISEVILGQKEWFETWVRGERTFTDNQFNEIIYASDAWNIVGDTDEEAFTDKTVRPSQSARRIKSLLEQITDRYKPLPRFSHKARFLVEVQIPVLEFYHTRISESLDAFESLSSFLVRSVPGALSVQSVHGTDTKRMTTGVEGLQRLVKAFVSAKWMAGVMEVWGEDVFFLELWHSICEKAHLRKSAEENPSLPNPSSSREDGTIFEELITQYKTLADRAEGMIVRQICGEVEAALKAHLASTSEAHLDESVVSQTLLAPIACFSSHLNFLRTNLPRSSAAGLYRQTASNISSHILHRVVIHRGRGQMSLHDGKVLFEECRLWIESCRLALGPSVRKAEAPWKTLLDSSRLLSLEKDVFQRAVNVVNLGNDTQLEELKSDLGIGDMTPEMILDTLQVRDDYLA